MKSKHIVVVAPPGTTLLDAAGPLDVFSRANYFYKQNVNPSTDYYTVHTFSAEKTKTVTTSCGLPIVTEGHLKNIDFEIDTFLIAGAPNPGPEMVGRDTIDWLKANAKRIRRLGSVCTGAFILAEAGLLDGKNATTHWMCCKDLEKLYPKIQVDPDPIFVKDGKIYTSAGISTGLDLSLALVEEDLGRELALSVARRLVLYLKRPGNQAQFSSMLLQQSIDHKPIQDIQQWVANHLDKELTVELLADKALMSPRNFARTFVKEIGITPAKYIEKIRLETARRRLEETQLTQEEIAMECGLKNGENLRRLFLRHLRTTPNEYRKNFKTAMV